MTILLLLLSALAGSSLSQFTFVPVHGCEWVPQSTPLTNFTYTHNPTNTTLPGFVQWQAPAIGITCNATNPTFTGFRNASYVACVPPAREPSQGTITLSEDRSNATLTFEVYEQCAADIFAFHYQAVVGLRCESDGRGGEACVDGGSAVANVTAEEYLPPIRNPPPPPSTIHW